MVDYARRKSIIFLLIPGSDHLLEQMFAVFCSAWSKWTQCHLWLESRVFSWWFVGLGEMIGQL